MGYVSFFENFIQIAVLLFAWLIVLLSFFILAIQLFVTLIEFKLTTLASFVLIPFGLFGKTAFLAERVLGNVVSSGVKVLVLAVIIGIGSMLFTQFTQGAGGAQPTIDDAMTLVLAALTLLGLGVFGPGVANGIVSGGPQLGAGAVVGTGLIVAGGAAATYGAARYAGGALDSLGGNRDTAAATMIPPGSGPGSPSAPPSFGAPPSGPNGGPGGGIGVARGQFSSASAIGTAPAAGGGSDPSMTPDATAPLTSGEPAWAKRLKRAQTVSHGLSLAAHSIRAGDAHGAGASINLSEAR